MNVKPLIIDKLKQAIEEFDDYTFGQIIYSMLRELPTEDNDTENFKRSMIFECKDKEMYAALNRILINEKEEY